MNPHLHEFDPSDPEARRRGTVIGAPASGFAGEGNPVVDAGSWAIARARWSLADLARVPLEALALSVPLPPIDQRVVGRAFYERAKLAGAVLELRAAAEDLVLCASTVGALLRGAMFADDGARETAKVRGAELVASIAAFGSVWGRHSGLGDMPHPWPTLRASSGARLWRDPASRLP